MKLLVWNVNGVLATKANIDITAAYGSMAAFFSRLGDIACLQVRANPAQLPRVQCHAAASLAAGG